MRRIWVIGFVLALAGCAVSRPTWVHPTATESQLLRDRYECKREALMVPQLPARVPSASSPQGFAEGFERGMQWQAWHRAQAREEAAVNLYSECMQIKGYQLRWVTE